MKLKEILIDFWLHKLESMRLTILNKLLKKDTQFNKFSLYIVLLNFNNKDISYLEKFIKWRLVLKPWGAFKTAKTFFLNGFINTELLCFLKNFKNNKKTIKFFAKIFLLNLFLKVQLGLKLHKNVIAMLFKVYNINLKYKKK